MQAEETTHGFEVCSRAAVSMRLMHCQAVKIQFTQCTNHGTAKTASHCCESPDPLPFQIQCCISESVSLDNKSSHQDSWQLLDIANM